LPFLVLALPRLLFVITSRSEELDHPKRPYPHQPTVNPLYFSMRGLAVILLALATNAAPQASEPYTLTVPVDEVVLTFHASDFSGRPINDLSLPDLRILDNNKRPRQIVSFDAYQDLPIRTGILIDTSNSVLPELKRTISIATEYTTHLIHQKTDLAFVTRFDSQTKVLQDWTHDTDLLTDNIRNIASDYQSRIGGTVLFDSLYRACHEQFGRLSDIPSGNFIMLFTDGVDNASHARLQDDIEACQRTHTAIYVFSTQPRTILSDGQKTLQELASKSGGRIFFDQTPEKISTDLRLIEADQRTQYRLIYKPAHFKPNGEFHRIKLDSPNRGGVITTRSGYYASH
jgi:VWFA-related protein